MEQSQNPQISSDSKTKGFDLSAGKTWIYPENYPVRDYQFSIVEASLYNNTLVCLPTGLGKTFIAAVVMYNFWRWYPCGKVVFLAPTKPLVAQQISACHNIMGIPVSETIELTGAVNQKQREIAWSNKRVVFATPQVFHNDLEKNVAPGDSIKCVVIDEAHKALGKHSYCECIRILSEKNQFFRILALSATPGNKIDNVHEVLQNLHIAHVELKDETSSDIVPYINERKVDIILVPLNNELTQYKERYIFIMDRHVKVLLQCNVLRGQTANISKGRVFHLLKEFQKKTNKSSNHGQIMKTLNILMTMYHAYELMIRDGLRAFYKFYQNHSDKFWMNQETHLLNLLEDIKVYLGSFPDIKASCDETVADISQDLIFGHTKFEKLKELLLQHFKNSRGKQDDTRAIVFVEYRDIVNEIYILLLQCRPLIRPQMFVGQAGQKQKQQIKALENFRNNRVNVLISTSIGEEGIDVGEVDLIICFDISQHSPTRLVQRMGRTGRKRDGHIIILVTDGREHETLRSTMARRDSLNYKILNTSNISSSLYQNNPRMIPEIYEPECLKMHISIQPASPIIKSKNKKEKPKDSKSKNVRKKITAKETNLELQKNKGQFSVTKYFTSDKPEEQKNDVLTMLNANTSQYANIRNTIKPSDVKILSCDSDTLDFLTICALKNSENETDTREKHGNGQFLYMPKFPQPKHFFDFSIPDVKILNCLNTLNDIASAEHNASKFEYLLDDTSESNEDDILNIDGQITENNSVHSIPEAIVSLNEYPSFNDSKIMIKDYPDSQDLEAGKFEDMLDETSDESENNTRVENFEQKQTENLATFKNVNCKASTNDSQVDNIQLYDTYFKETMEINDNFSLIRLSEHSVKQDKEKDHSNSKCSKLGESKNQNMFSITQEISETTQLNVKLEEPKMVDESEDDMFQDKSFQISFANEKSFEPKDKYSVDDKKSNNDINFDESSYFKSTTSAVNTDLKADEFEWDDDFETLIDGAQSSVALNIIEEKSDQLEKNNCKVDEQYSDSEDWISVKKSSQKENVPSMSISKKLSRVTNFRNAKDDYACKNIENERTHENDLFENVMNESIDSEKSHFFNETKNDSTKYESTTENRLKMVNVRDRNRIRKPKKSRNEFIDDEAEVTVDVEYAGTDESSGADEDLENFVSYTQNVHDTSEMYAHYLRTIKSPIKNRDGFLFKKPRTLDPDIEIYSQPVTQEHESYIDDSFCVTGDDAMTTGIEELSELEKAEQELERRKRKRNRGEKSDTSTRKKSKKTKRRNIISYCSSSEDETEKLREEIKDYCCGLDSN